MINYNDCFQVGQLLYIGREAGRKLSSPTNAPPSPALPTSGRLARIPRIILVNTLLNFSVPYSYWSGCGKTETSNTTH
jgi:hypothetical protein